MVTRTTPGVTSSAVASALQMSRSSSSSAAVAAGPSSTGSVWGCPGRGTSPHGLSQQQGRAILTISQLPRLTALDVQTLDDEQLEQAARLFDEFAERDFLPANEAYRDETRQALDRAVLCGLLGLPESILGPLAALRLQWCEEPSVHGGKPTRPGGGG